MGDKPTGLGATTVGAGGFEQRLAARTEPFLAQGEKVQAAFVAWTGHSPTAFTASDALTIVPAPLPVVLLSFIATGGWRDAPQWFTVALTNQSVLVLKNGRRNRPKTLMTRLPIAGSIGDLSGDGDFWVRVAGVQCWLPPAQTDVVYRINRAHGSTKPRQ
jgi:hypothetical protein